MLFTTHEYHDGVTSEDGWYCIKDLSNVDGNNYNDEMSSMQIYEESGHYMEIHLYQHASFAGYDWKIISYLNGEENTILNDQLLHFSHAVMKSGTWFRKPISWNDQVTSMKYKIFQ